MPDFFSCEEIIGPITEAAAEKNFASNISGKWEANPGRQECLVG
jgi:hypothetical protein